LAGAALGFVYALADRRVTLSPRLTRAAGYAALVVVMLGALGGLGGFFVAVDDPVGYVETRWEEFKTQPDREAGPSHLATIGSNRYDFWRVALDEFGEQPLRGAGGRSFGPAYLREGDTQETPLRSHSLVFDLLGETGFVGLFLLVAALLPFAWIVVRRARHDLLAAGVVGAAAYWLVQASGDWTWTFPAVGVPFFLLLAVGAVGVENDRRLTARAALPAAAALAVMALFVFAPPWLSARYTVRALEQDRADAADELRWARRLDPLSLDPLIAEAELASAPEDAIPPLEEAVEREPDSLGPRYVLGLTYLDAGRRAEARRELREALRLAPRNRRVRQALRRAEAARSGG
jgi:O-antigen ligase